MKKLLTILALCITTISFAQSENANWCFAYQARLDFNSGSPVPGLCANDNNFFINTYGVTCASVSNSSGDLLFYTDGVRVWDRQNNLMPHGSNIGGGIGTAWAEQGAVIVPKPGSETIYYIFTACKYFYFPPPNQNHGGFHYVTVDLSKNGGNGDIVTDLNNDPIIVPLSDEDGNPIDFDFYNGTGLQIFESGMTTALNDTHEGIWLVIFTRFHENGVVKRMSYSYLVGANGIGSNLASGTTSPLPNSWTPLAPKCLTATIGCAETGGSIKISPNGDFLCSEGVDEVDMYLFHKQSGNVEFKHPVYSSPLPGMVMPGYGIEFSPGCQTGNCWIYFSVLHCGLCVAKGAVPASPGSDTGANRRNYIRIYVAPVMPEKEDTITVVGEFEIPTQQNDMIIPPGTITYGDLQLAVDGRIYACAAESNIFPHPPTANLGVIIDPDWGPNCQYINNGVTLATGAEQYGSLPQWVHKAVVPLPYTGPWTWMNGDDIPNQLGNYGILNQPSLINKPPARYDAATWTDQNGIFWMFGGTKSVNEMYNDLWQYDKGSMMWTWKGGSNTINAVGNYGVLGITSPANQPGARAGALTWFDLTRNCVWLFGGWVPTNPLNASDKLNDLWRYDLTNGYWTWESGSNSINQYAIYGTQNLPSINNRPGAKGGAASWPIDGEYLWLFGGDGWSSAYGGLQNDLWKYRISTKEWTWVKGEDITTNNSTLMGIYGTQGQEALANRPGSRAGAVTWVDNSNNLWLFGGGGWGDNPNPGSLNDMWRFNKISGNWKWVDGDNSPDQYGIYGTLGQPALTNKPGSRTNAVCWKSADGNFWMWGGHGLSQNSAALLNDLWKYDPVGEIWTWTDGANTITAPPVYGTMGQSTPTTNPGGRFRSCAWIDIVKNNLWLFGGIRYASGIGNSGNLNDLWKYTGNCTGPNCRPTNSFSPGNFLNENFQQRSNDLQIKTEEKIDLPKIHSLEIYNPAGQLLKKISSDLESYGILKNSRAGALMPGLYFIRVIFKDKTSKTVRRFLK